MKKNALYTVCRAVWLTLRAAPWQAGSFLAVGIAAALLNTLSAVANNRLFDAVEAQIAGGQWPAVLPALFAAGMAVILTQLFALFAKTCRSITDRTVQGRLKRHVQEAAARLEPAAFEDPGTLNALEKAERGRASCAAFSMAIFNMTAARLPYFVSMGVYLYRLRPILALSIPMLALPSFAIYLMQAKMFGSLEDTVSPARRRSAYYDRCLSDRAFFKETRLLGAYRYFFDLFCCSIREYCRESARVEKRANLRMILTRVITLLGFAGMLWLLFDSLMGGYITVGAFAAVFASVTSLMYSMMNFFDQDFKAAMRAWGSVRSFVAFSDRPARPFSDAVPDRRAACELRDVHFTYPGASQETLRGVTLSIRPGETLAIVGENGAGKSTLARLLLGEYAPTQGAVLAGGVSLSDATPEDRYRDASAVFQHFGRYRMTLTENVTLSDAREDAEAMTQALDMADLALDRSFPDGADTCLSREFGGVDLSGGQWQRVAIARGLYRPHTFIILDEPTAAIDPMEESRLYRRFASITADRTAVIVTHRLGSARIADRIVVMEDGRIDAVGTHAALVKQGGEYARLWQAQAGGYAPGGYAPAGNSRPGISVGNS